MTYSTHGFADERCPTVTDPLLLSVIDLKVHFYTYAGIVEALDGVTFDAYRGQTVGLVGETGCGKSVTALTIMGLVPIPGKVEGGKILFEGENLLEKSPKEIRRIRGKKISMIFQDPMTYLNPVFTIGDQITEVLRLHEDSRQLIDEWKQSQDHGSGNPGKPETITIHDERRISRSKDLFKPARGELKQALRWKTIQMLKLVRMPEPDKIFNEYPHELSGGMRQRCMIAMMLSTHPDILIADEPTTALDVTIQAQVLSVLRELKKALGLCLILITHDLAIVAENCDVVNVMYAGRIVETGPTARIFANPQHPYTQGLLKSLPTIHIETESLSIIHGSVPSLINPPRGCRFHPRCPFAMMVCKMKDPRLLPTEEEHTVACFLYHEA